MEGWRGKQRGVGRGEVRAGRVRWEGAVRHRYDAICGGGVCRYYVFIMHLCSVRPNMCVCMPIGYVCLNICM